MGRPKGSTNKSGTTTAKAKPKTEGLLAALDFVSVAGTKSVFSYQTHVTLLGHMAMMFDGQMAAGHPIAEDLSCCPHFDKLRVALTKAGGAVAITELDMNRLRVKGVGTFTVPCLPDLQASMAVPDAPVAVIDDRLKAAFAICGVLVSEAAEDAMGASVLLGPDICTSTNRHVLFQAAHGINLPPNLLVPKIFTNAVCKQAAALTGFGFGHDGERFTSVTFWFDNGAWIKTQLYFDYWPVENIPAMIDLPCSPVPVPEGLFDAIAAVSEFSELGVYLLPGRVQSHFNDEVGAQFPVGINGGKIISPKYMALAAPFATSIDLDTQNDRVLFFGEGMRGVVMCIEPGDVVAATPFANAGSFPAGDYAYPKTITEDVVWVEHGPDATNEEITRSPSEQPAPAVTPGLSWNDA